MPIEDWLVMRATMTAPTETAAQVPSRQSPRPSRSSSSARSPESAQPVSSMSKSLSLPEPFAMRCLRPPLRPSPNQPANINRKWAAAGAVDVESGRIGVSMRHQNALRGRRRNEGSVMTGRTSLTIVLAAGEGTRMRSATPKVLHPVAGQSLLSHVLSAAPRGKGASLAVVIGPDHHAVAEEAKRYRGDVETFVQHSRMGTAHAVLAARDAMARGADDLIVAFGDTPL